MALLSKAKPKRDITDSPSDWFDRPTQAPVTDLRAVNSATSKEKYRRWAIWGTLGLVPLLCILVFALANLIVGQSGTIDGLKASVKTLNDKPAGGTAQVSTSAGRFAAQQEMVTWLASSPSPLPGGKLSYWAGSRSLDSKSKTDIRTLETFILVGGNGSGYRATYEVSIDPRGGAAVMTGPSLEAVSGSASDNWQSTQTWSGISSVSDVTTQVTGAVQSWANAYVSGNPQQLGLVVGDPNANHTYEPMSGASSVAITVKQFAKAPNGAIAQVEMIPKWDDAIRSDANNGDGGTPIVMDVLLKNTETAAPQVIAWGAPGTGPSLKAYQNALMVPSTALSTPTPSAEPSTNTGPTQAPAKTQTPTAPPAKPKAPAKK